MVEFMCEQVIVAMKRKVKSSTFLALSCDEVTTANNGSWICIYAYIVDHYSRILLMISLQRIVDNVGADNLTQIITRA